MIHPTADDVLGAVIDTFEREIAPLVDDEYAASLCLTVGQLLRSVRARVALEGPALFDDNAELRDLLASLRADVPAALAATIDDAVARPVATYPTLADLQADAVALRAALVEVIAALPDPDHPGRVATRGYLAHQLARQQPWLVDAFTGPRR